MSTVRIQLRRGLAAEWTAADSVGLGVVLADGEVGVETDTGKFKIGNGLSKWSLLEYYLTADEVSSLISNAISSLIDSAPSTLNTLNELAAALNDDANYATTISTALGAKLDTTTAAATYAPINSPTFTGTVSGITKSMVGLANVDNTSDANKPISSATQTALDGKLDKVTVINQQSSTYTVTTADSGRLIEMSGGGFLDIVDSALFPVGFTVNVLQTGASQVTLRGSGFTINATPGLRLRAQWSSATLIKRGLNSWVAMGDLSA